MNESALLARAVHARDVAAFAALVRLHQPRVRGFLTRMTRGDRALADDLAQETFLLAWRKIGQYRFEGSFPGWLCGIAYSRALMELRKKKLEPLDDTDWVIGPETETAKQVKLDVEKALARLSPPERGALTLCYTLGFSHEEAARILNAPLGTVKSHMLRGREKMRTMLRAWSPETTS
jgi:RNA polymerase sigma-70 factor (ECF subfamily)